MYRQQGENVAEAHCSVRCGKKQNKKIKAQGRVIFGNGKGGGGINENTAEWFIIMVMINKGGAWFLF